MTGSEDFLLHARAVVRGVDPSGAADVVDNGAVAVRGGVIAAVDKADRLSREHPDLPVRGSADTVVMPGLVNAHHHTGLTPLQLGMPFAPLELWLPHFLGVRAVDPRLDTLYSAIEMLETGTTTVQHIQGGVAGPSDRWSETADAILGAYADIGMRASYCFMIRDQNQLAYDDDAEMLALLPEDLAAWLGPALAAGRAPVAEMMAFFVDLKRRWAGREPDRVRVQLAPANLHWCSDAALETIFGTAREHGVKLHMHLSETHLQAEEAVRRTGRSAIRHLADLGCLGPDLTLGHAIWCDEADLDLLAEAGTCVCHNASSGLRLASGIAPVNAMRAKGVRVALGIDQCGINDDRDMLQEMRVAWMIHREPGLFRERPAAADVLRMATEGGAATTGFEGRIGRLAPGLAADLVTIDWRTVAEPYLDARTPLVDALVQRCRQRSVRDVYVAGRRVVAGGRVVSVDRDAVHREIGDRLARPASPDETTARKGVDRLMPHLENYYRGRGDSPPPRYSYNSLN